METVRFFLMIILLTWFGGALAADPVVSGVSLSQRTDGSGLVDIQYDLQDSDGGDLSIAVNISDTGGESWNFPCTALHGDVGHGVEPGSGKNIVWDIGADAPGMALDQIMARVVASDAGVIHSTHSPGNYWITEYGWVDWTDQNIVEKMAKADVLLFNSWYLWGDPVNEELMVIDKLKAINPDLKVLAYVQAKTSNLHWENDFRPFTREMYERTLPYWSYTTEGDTLMDWPNQVVLDLLNPDCREVIAGTIAEFYDASNNQVDGVFWDYFNNKIWVAYNIRDQVFGDPDMDGDGLPMAQDVDEMEAYQAACDSLVMRTRELLGDDFIQVFNGQRAMADSAFAALGDGIYYEIFPTELFPDPDMATALDPQYENNLFRTMQWPRSDNGGPYNVLANQWTNFYFDENLVGQELPLGNIFRAIGLLTGTFTNWLGQDGHHYDWPEIEINLGEPVAPVVINGSHFFRQYQHGTVEVNMESGAYPNALNYQIFVNGQLVEALDTPYSYP